MMTDEFLAELKRVLEPGDFERLQIHADDEHLGDIRLSLAGIINAALYDLVDPLEISDD